MQPELIQTKYNQLLEAVRKMRGWQREYGKYHVSADRDKMRFWERQVDRLIGEQVKEQQSKQGNIF